MERLKAALRATDETLAEEWKTSPERQRAVALGAVALHNQGIDAIATGGIGMILLEGTQPTVIRAVEPGEANCGGLQGNGEPPERIDRRHRSQGPGRSGTLVLGSGLEHLDHASLEWVARSKQRRPDEILHALCVEIDEKRSENGRRGDLIAAWRR